MELSIIRETRRFNRVTLKQVRKRLCVGNEETWAQQRTLWDTIGKGTDLRDVVIDDDCVAFVR